MSVSCSPSSVSVGSATSCKAVVTNASGSTAATPAGSVSFTSDGSGLFASSGSCTLADGQCTLSYTPSAVGSQTIAATYAGDSTHAGSNNHTNETIKRSKTRASTVMSVSCSPSSVSVGSATSCKAVVTNASGSTAATPAGSVSFTSDGSGLFASSGSCTLADGQCTLSYTPSAVGSQTIAATYAGDRTHAGSNSHTSETITTVTTDTTVTCSPSSVSVGTATSCKAVVTNASGSTAATPAGSVSFTSDGSGLFASSGSCTLADGQCTLSYTPSAVGSQTIAATYAGDSTHAGSNNHTSETITPPAFR